MTETFIQELILGQDVNSTFALRVKKLLPLRSGAGQYLAVVLGDKTGQIEGRVWENAEKVYQGCQVGDIVQVQGQVTEYNGKIQIQIAHMFPSQAGTTDPSRFIPSSKLDQEDAIDYLNSLVNSLKNAHLKELLSFILADEDFFNAFVIAPAAKRNHHATIGGLLEHSLNIVRAAEQVTPVYPQIDRDLLVAGALLHDIGKVGEYDFYTDIDFTDEGRLLGHIVIGTQILESYMNQLPDFPRELRLKLLHLIVSHHGQYEWQSPKRPKFLEAVLLHHLDMIDAEVDMFCTAAANLENPQDHWSSWVKGLDRFVYCK
jgi:3'-5' exoribonuclease